MERAAAAAPSVLRTFAFRVCVLSGDWLPSCHACRLRSSRLRDLAVAVQGHRALWALLSCFARDGRARQLGSETRPHGCLGAVAIRGRLSS